MESAVAVLRRRAGTIAAAIVRRSPAGAITVVFAGGSVARGAVWAAAIDGWLEIYSDIDLYIVVADPAQAGAVRAAAREVIRAASETEPGVRYLRGVDAGVCTGADLRRQPVRPGTADLAANHLALWGDAAAIPGLLGAPAGPMDAAEALYLLENRAWDVFTAPGTSPAEQRLRRVLELKLELDIAAAHLIAAGVTAQRVPDPAATIAAGDVAGLDRSVSEAAARAGRMRGDLTAFLLAPANHGGVAADRVCAAWRALAPRVLSRPDAGTGALVAERCMAGRRFANLREFVRVAGCVGMSRGSALAAGFGCAARSARATLRVHAIVHGLATREPAAAIAHSAHAERVTAALGFGAGSLDHRVHAAHRAIS